MSEASVFRQKAEMFEQRAESATDPISRQHYREMAAHSSQTPGRAPRRSVIRTDRLAERRSRPPTRRCVASAEPELRPQHALPAEYVPRGRRLPLFAWLSTAESTVTIPDCARKAF